MRVIESDELREWVVASCAESGVPFTVTDPAALEAIRELLSPHGDATP